MPDDQTPSVPRPRFARILELAKDAVGGPVESIDNLDRQRALKVALQPLPIAPVLFPVGHEPVVVAVGVAQFRVVWHPLAEAAHELRDGLCLVVVVRRDFGGHRREAHGVGDGAGRSLGLVGFVAQQDLRERDHLGVLGLVEGHVSPLDSYGSMRSAATCAA